MYKNFVALLVYVGSVSNVVAETTASHCAKNETNLFSCTLSNNKVISLCSTIRTAHDTGYLQYRYGKLGRIEQAIPRSKSGIPSLTLLLSKDKYLEYNKVAIESTPFTYNIESFRQLKKVNKDGYPNTKSSDTLNIEDGRKTVLEGNLVSYPCSALGTAVDAKAIGKLTGIKLERLKF